MRGSQNWKMPIEICSETEPRKSMPKCFLYYVWIIWTVLWVKLTRSINGKISPFIFVWYVEHTVRSPETKPKDLVGICHGPWFDWNCFRINSSDLANQDKDFSPTLCYANIRVIFWNLVWCLNQQILHKKVSFKFVFQL